jgi:hypothetical protein
MFVIVAKGDDLYPHKPSVATAGTAGSGDLVHVRFVGNIIL